MSLLQSSQALDISKLFDANLGLLAAFLRSRGQHCLRVSVGVSVCLYVLDICLVIHVKMSVYLVANVWMGTRVCVHQWMHVCYSS